MAKKGKKDTKSGKDKGKKGKGKPEKAKKISAARISRISRISMPKQELPKKPDPCELYQPDDCLNGIFCNPNVYPGLLKTSKPMAIVGARNGNYKNFDELLQAGFHCADRVLLMTPWGNYVVFRANNPEKGKTVIEDLVYFLYDGCTCNINSFRHFDLSVGTAGFITFVDLNSLISYILNSRFKREKLCLLTKPLLDDMCKEKRPMDEDGNKLVEPDKVPLNI